MDSKIKYYGPVTLSTKDHYKRAKLMSRPLVNIENTSDEMRIPAGSPPGPIENFSRTISQTADLGDPPGSPLPAHDASPSASGDAREVEPLAQTASPEGSVDVVTGKNRHVCKRCTRIMYDRSHLERHEKLHVKDEKAKVCGSGAPTKVALKYKCKFCPMRWTVQNPRNRHQATHGID
ncbi:hypothetical protein BD311DRAFT_747862 [Dichomitus squalens]|uniref:C2H2-type domain-containing protein n=1 Tax=Dichomitus squalens TaxID=114155 RepID=A0A4Q9N1G3_9APHY|nr:hypothetical protein BD311DRAFT_747862 [Dichomitus squalens]